MERRNLVKGPPKQYGLLNISFSEKWRKLARKKGFGTKETKKRDDVGAMRVWKKKNGAKESHMDFG